MWCARRSNAAVVPKRTREANRRVRGKKTLKILDRPVDALFILVFRALHRSLCHPCWRASMSAEAFLEPAAVPRVARFAAARPFRVSVIRWGPCSVWVCFLSRSRSRSFSTPQTCHLVGETNPPRSCSRRRRPRRLPVRARWAALHLQLSTFALDAWQEVAGGGGGGGKGSRESGVEILVKGETTETESTLGETTDDAGGNKTGRRGLARRALAR